MKLSHEDIRAAKEGFRFVAIDANGVRRAYTTTQGEARREVGPRGKVVAIRSMTAMARNPSSGAKQRKRGVREYVGASKQHARHMQRMAGARADARDESGLRVEDIGIQKFRHGQSRYWAAQARGYEPKLPNPSSGAKQRKRGVRQRDFSGTAGDRHALMMQRAVEARSEVIGGDITWHAGKRKHGQAMYHAGQNRPALPNPSGKRRNPGGLFTVYAKLSDGGWHPLNASPVSRAAALRLVKQSHASEIVKAVKVRRGKQGADVAIASLRKDGGM